MKKLKALFIFIIALLLLACLLVVGVYAMFFCGIPVDLPFDHQIRKVPRETETLPAFVGYGVLHYNDKEYVIDDLVQTLPGADAHEAVCIKDNAVYIVCTYEGDWHVVRWGFDTQELSKVCTLSDPDGYGYYRYENEFYIDSKIILTDMQNVVEYNLETDAVCSCPYSEYDFPQPSSYGNKIDDNTLALTLNNEERIFTIEDMQQDSPSLAAIPGLHLVQYSIQIADDKVFVVMETKSRMGEAYAVVAKYENDVWKYVNSYFTGDIVSGRGYIVPTN